MSMKWVGGINRSISMSPEPHKSDGMVMVHSAAPL